MSPSSIKGRVYKQVGRLLLGPCGERASWMRPTGCDRQSWSAGKGTGASDINVETVVVYYRALPSRTIKIHKKKKKKKNSAKLKQRKEHLLPQSPPCTLSPQPNLKPFASSSTIISVKVLSVLLACCTVPRCCSAVIATVHFVSASTTAVLTASQRKIITHSHSFQTY